MSVQDDVRELVLELDRIWEKYGRLDAVAHRLEAIVSSVVRERVYFERWSDGRRSLWTLPPRWRKRGEEHVGAFTTEELLARAERSARRRESMIFTRTNSARPDDEGVPIEDLPRNLSGSEQGPARPRIGHEWARDDDGRPQK